MYLDPKFESLYPNLRTHGYEVTSEETCFKRTKYNCVAWAAIGDIERWWQAGRGPGYFWPKCVLDDGYFDSYVQLFERLGYRSCTNRKLELMYEKVALFAFPDRAFQHVTYQTFSGWTSKLGDREDIRHKTLEGMEGGDYGDVKIVMKRLSGFRGVLARISPIRTAHLWPIDRERICDAKKKSR